MRIVDTGYGLLKYFFVFPIIGYSIYSYLNTGSDGFWYLSWGGFGYIILLAMIDVKINKRLRTIGIDKNFGKIEIEELQNEINQRSMTVEKLNQDMQSLIGRVKSVEKKFVAYNQKCTAYIHSVLEITGGILERESVDESKKIIEVSKMMANGLHLSQKTMEVLDEAEKKYKARKDRKSTEQRGACLDEL